MLCLLVNPKLSQSTVQKSDIVAFGSTLRVSPQDGFRAEAASLLQNTSPAEAGQAAGVRGKPMLPIRQGSSASAAAKVSTRLLNVLSLRSPGPTGFSQTVMLFETWPQTSSNAQGEPRKRRARLWSSFNSPNRRCSVSISQLPVCRAMYLAEKIVRLALSVYRSNMAY